MSNKLHIEVSKCGLQSYLWASLPVLPKARIIMYRSSAWCLGHLRHLVWHVTLPLLQCVDLCNQGNSLIPLLQDGCGETGSLHFLVLTPCLPPYPPGMEPILSAGVVFCLSMDRSGLY